MGSSQYRTCSRLRDEKRIKTFSNLQAHPQTVKKSICILSAPTGLELSRARAWPPRSLITITIEEERHADGKQVGIYVSNITCKPPAKKLVKETSYILSAE